MMRIMSERDDGRVGDGGGGLPRMLSVLELLTEEELIQLNHIVVERLRLMQHIRAHGQMANLRIGQPVSFTEPGGRVISGTLTRYNRKSVTIVTTAGEQWRVAPGLVRPQLG
jgi:hypothetical protein